MPFIAGPYNWTFGSVAGPAAAILALGIVEDAPSLECASNSTDPITGDNLGDSVQDGVFRAGNCFLDLVIQEFNAAGAQKAFWPYATKFGDVGCVGALMSTFADELIGTPAAPDCAATGLQVFKGFKAVIAPGFPIRTLWGSRLRNVPIRFQLLPFSDISDLDPDTGLPINKWFEYIAP